MERYKLLGTWTVQCAGFSAESGFKSSYKKDTFGNVTYEATLGRRLESRGRVVAAEPVTEEKVGVRVNLDFTDFKETDEPLSTYAVFQKLANGRRETVYVQWEYRIATTVR